MAWIRLGFVISIMFVVGGCKTTSRSALHATVQQRQALKECIMRTVRECYPDSQIDSNALALFADDLVTRAPSDNDTANDYAFEQYVDELGCDPSATSKKGGFGVVIVGEWAVSPFNPENPQQ